jgi:uncharacterized protein
MKILKIIAATIVISSLSGVVYGQNTIMWKVTHPQTFKVSYLLGTYHYLGNTFVDSLEIIKEKLLASEIGVFESVGSLEERIAMLNRRSASDDIEKGLRKSDLKFLKAYASDWKVDLYKLRPSELILKLSQDYFIKHCSNIKSEDEWEHFDHYLIHISKENNLLVVGLETDSLQLELVVKNESNSGWKAKRKEVGFWINQIQNAAPATSDCWFINKYKKFDLDYAFEVDCKEDVLIKERNTNWLAVLPSYLKEQNCFIAVGFFHLTNRCGLIEELRNQGFLVEPVDMR